MSEENLNITKDFVVISPDKKATSERFGSNFYENLSKNYNGFRELENLYIELDKGDVLTHIRFLFDNSIVGFKLGESKEWKFKCFYPAQGFLDSTEYRVHEGLVRALNLLENRDRDQA